MNAKFLLAAISIVPNFAVGQEAVTKLDEIVVSPNRDESSLSGTGQSIFVLDQDKLEKAGAAPLLDTLATVPGVLVTRNGPAGSSASVLIRGISKRYTAVFVDGVRVDDPSGPQVAFDFGSLLSKDVARVEILKGSQSAVYGSSAVGGVVYITTRKMSEETSLYSANMEVGSFGTKSVSFSVGEKIGSTSIDLNANRFTTAGFSARNNSTTDFDNDGSQKSRLNVSIRHELNRNVSVAFSASKEKSRSEYDDRYSADQYWRTFDESNRAFYLNANYGAFKNKFEITDYKINRLYSSNYQTDGSRETASYRGSFQLSPELTARYGLERSVESVTGNEDLTTNSKYFGLEYSVDKLSLSSDLRFDESAKFKKVNSSRFSGTFSLSDRIMVKASYGTGFRAPSSSELVPYLYPGRPDWSYWVDGNIAAEDAESFDFGVEADLGSFSVNASIFQTEIDNAITYCTRNVETYAPTCPSGSIPSADYDAMYTNLSGKSRSRGLELSAQTFIPNLGNVNFGYTKVMGRAASGARIPNAPTHSANLSIQSSITQSLESTIQVSYSADSPNLGIKDYAVVNAAFSYALSDSTLAYLRIENIFDEKYTVIEDFNTAPRSIYFGVTQNF